MMTHSRSLTANRACDGCRRRKVKCDTEEPCANCRISHLQCQYTALPRRRGPRVPNSHDQAKTLSPRASSTIVQSLQNHIPVDGHQLRESLISDDGQEPRDEFGSPQAWRLANADILTTTEGLVQTTYSARSPRGIWDDVLVSIRSALPSTPVIDVVNYCIDLYMQYTFPAAPIVHEPSLRTDASIFFSGTSSIELFGSNDENQRVKHMRAFTIVTALCASVASVMPESLLPYRDAVTRPFLHASREMLKLYEDHDLEHPNSTSLSIRILHSTALQSTTGKKGAAWHVLGQATLLAQNLHLYSEQSIRRNDPVETQLLRLNFWHMYSSDKAASCLRSRPSILHELLFDEELTLHPYGELFTPLLDTSKPWYKKSFEERLLVGFHLVRRLWSTASSLIFDIKAHELGAWDEEAHKMRLLQAYLDFTGVMDDLPNWLQASNIMVSHDDGDVAIFHKTSFWVQRCTVMMTFHCLRLVILQQSIACKLWVIMGLNDQPITRSMKKVEMIHDFLQTLDDIPFLYHQIKGEPSVERIRWVGTVLLEMIQTTDNEALKVRANIYFTRLLDVLAKLNSKASDELSSGRA